MIKNKDQAYENIKKIIDEDEKAQITELMSARGVNEKIKSVAKNNPAGIYSGHIINFIIDTVPENYVRERSGRGKHFYNPKGKIMEEYREYMLHQMRKDDYDYTREIISHPEKTYYATISATYYLPIPVGDSKYKKVLKATNTIMPDVHKDLDNFDKFIIDALHNVIYDDDKRLVHITSDKKYSVHPRTELNIVILELKENTI